MFEAQHAQQCSKIADRSKMAAVKRTMTSEGRVSSHNLYGNLTGTHNRVATSIGTSSAGSNSIEQNHSPNIQFKLQNSKNSVDAQSKSNLLLSSELNSDPGRNSIVTRDVVKSQLPKMP